MKDPLTDVEFSILTRRTIEHHGKKPLPRIIVRYQFSHPLEDCILEKLTKKKQHFIHRTHKHYLFLLLRVFRLLSSFLLSFPHHFGWYVLRPSSVVCRTQKPTRNFELRPLLNPRGSLVLIPLAITRYKCFPVLLLTCSQDWTCNLQMIVSLEAYGTNTYNRYAVSSWTV